MVVFCGKEFSMFCLTGRRPKQGCNSVSYIDHLHIVSCSRASMERRSNRLKYYAYTRMNVGHFGPNTQWVNSKMKMTVGHTKISKKIRKKAKILDTILRDSDCNAILSDLNLFILLMMYLHADRLEI